MDEGQIVQVPFLFSLDLFKREPCKGIQFDRCGNFIWDAPLVKDRSFRLLSCFP